MIWKKAALSALLLFSPAVAQAATVSAANPASVVEALLARGGMADLARDDFGDPQIHAEIGGWKAVVLFYDCADGGAGCRSLQFRASFDAPTAMTPEAAQAFMRANRYAAVVLDANGDPRLQWDLVTGAGVDRAVFDEALSGFSTALAAMGRQVFPARP